jgi:spermidine synthase
VRIRTIDQTLTLRERGGVVEVVSVEGGMVLLSSAALETERELGRLVSSLMAAPAKRVLVGGLGFGATVRGVLDVVGADTRVVVVEKLAAIERLARGEYGHFSGCALDDPRVEVVVGDVADAIAGEHAALDAIVLDVDNGPSWASFRTNARLYAAPGLVAAREALAPGGALAVWSGYEADAFLARLRAAGFAPSVVPLRERGAVRARAYVGRRLG